jgi:hypothetical protein
MAEEAKKEVEQKVEVASPEQTEAEKQLAEKNAQIEQLTLERNNYKKGMLKAKGKKVDDEPEEDEEDLDAKVNRKVQEALLDTKLQTALKEKDDIIKKAFERNKELETTIANRSQIASAGTGSGNEAKLVAKDNVLSQEKINYFKSQGKTDAWIERYKENLIKTANAKA